MQETIKSMNPGKCNKTDQNQNQNNSMTVNKLFMDNLNEQNLKFEK